MECPLLRVTDVVALHLQAPSTCREVSLLALLAAALSFCPYHCQLQLMRKGNEKKSTSDERIHGDLWALDLATLTWSSPSARCMLFTHAPSSLSIYPYLCMYGMYLRTIG